MNQHQPQGFIARIMSALAECFAPANGGGAARPTDGPGANYVVIPNPTPVPARQEAPQEQAEADRDAATSPEPDELEGAEEFQTPEPDPFGELADDDLLPLTRDHDIPHEADGGQEQAAGRGTEHLDQADIDDEPALHDADQPGVAMAEDLEGDEPTRGDIGVMESPGTVIEAADEGGNVGPDTEEAAPLDEAPSGGGVYVPAQETACAERSKAPEEEIAETDEPADVAAIVAGLTTTAKGRATIPSLYFEVMRRRFGHNRKDVQHILSAGEMGAGQRGDGKQILCGWVETLLLSVPDHQLTLSEIRTSLPEFIRRAYGGNASQGLTGAVSRCTFLLILRNGTPAFETRAKAADLIRLK